MNSNQKWEPRAAMKFQQKSEKTVNFSFKGYF
jgi:hypothetical protein